MCIMIAAGYFNLMTRSLFELDIDDVTYHIRLFRNVDRTQSYNTNNLYQKKLMGIRGIRRLVFYNEQVWYSIEPCN